MPFAKLITLTGQYATLEPLGQTHHDELVAAVSDGELWKLWYTHIPHPEKMSAEIDRRLTMQEQGLWLPFAIRRLDTSAICGMTSYLCVEAAHRRLEIGATWYANSAQRTGINTDCKLMLLTHAFETLRCISVEFRTNFMNHQSRAAIERLGAKQDGILRNHQLNADGTYRDTVAFSIIDSEWPTVKRHLQYKLQR
jgi:RimJ/RimL family protein N-acetyltransferase